MTQSSKQVVTIMKVRIICLSPPQERCLSPLRENSLPCYKPCLASWSCQRIQQRLCLLQDRRVKAFGEPAIDRREQVTRFHLFTLVAPEPSEADGGSQLRELGALPF